MMRIYRPTAEAMLLQALYTKYSVGVNNVSDIAQALRNFSPSLPRDQMIFSQAKKSCTGVKMAELVEDLFNQLAEDQSPRKESDLIDEIVRVLQLPYARNALSGETLRRLRSALLLPSEQGGLMHRLRARELSCGGCGTDFHNRESITFSYEDGVINFYCHRCSSPAAVSCAGCAAQAELSAKAISAMSKMLCPTCLAKKQTGEVLKPPQRISALEPAPSWRSAPAQVRINENPAPRVPITPSAFTAGSFDDDAPITVGSTFGTFTASNSVPFAPDGGSQ